MMPLFATMARHMLPTYPENTSPAPEPHGQGSVCDSDVTGGLDACATILGMVFVLLEEQAANERRTRARSCEDTEKR